MARPPARPLLLVDVDGVLSLFGFPAHDPPPGTWASVDGIPHRLSATAGEHLHRLAQTFELVWCTGWEEKADAELPHHIGAPAGLPHVVFDRAPGERGAHWKLAGIDDHAGHRPLAWVDDAFNDACHAWAAQRPAPTLLLRTDPPTGLTAAHVEELEAWAAALPPEGSDLVRASPSRHGV
jgi:hypothetical protein